MYCSAAILSRQVDGFPGESGPITFLFIANVSHYVFLYIVLCAVIASRKRATKSASDPMRETGVHMGRNMRKPLSQ